jgi:hypothetical protein
MAGAIEELVAAAAAVPEVPESGSEARKSAHERLAVAAARVQAGKFSPADVLVVVKAQPLVGVKAGSEILGLAPPNFRRYRERLAEIEVEGSASVFVRSQVEELAAGLAADREGRKAGAEA